METRQKSIVLGGGCFWCLDASYRLIKGVTDVISGYAGGTTANPTMEQVYGGDTGHAEVVKVEYNPKIISLNDLLDVFWTIHDPTTLNRQMYDVGTEYRSIIFYNDTAEQKIIEKSKEAAQKVWSDKIVTEIVPFKVFYPADDDQQNFFQNHPEKSYCQIIINPKLKKLREKLSNLLKT